jgi:pimeloyl-ACP methyl ester carboxylesterase
MQKNIRYESATIQYTLTGTGKPVILLHGFGEDSSVWRYQVPALSEQFCLIIPDLPGSGASEMIKDMSMAGIAEVIHAIIHEENIETCPVIGHSMGGYIALALVEKYYNHVSALGLFHSSSYADSDEKKAARRKGIEFIGQHGPFEFLKTATLNLFSPLSRENNPGLIDEQLSLLHNFSAPALVSYYEGMMSRPDRSAVLLQTGLPVLFIIGTHDAAVPPADSLKQSYLPEKSYIHILQDSGHMGMLEEKERCTRILEEFLLDN